MSTRIPYSHILCTMVLMIAALLLGSALMSMQPGNAIAATTASAAATSTDSGSTV